MQLQVKEGVISGEVLTCDICPANKDCKFDRKRDGVGGFKGKGQRERYVSFRLITDAADGHRASETFISCRQFTETMEHRMRHGKQLREDGKDGEIITLTGTEGHVIKCRVQVKVNSRGQIIQPQAEIVEALRAYGHEVNDTDMSHPAGWKEVVYERTVPRMDEVAPASRYDQEMLEQQREHDLVGQETAEQLWEQAQRRMDAQPDTMPVKRGPGRPRKVTDGGQQADND